MAIEIAGEDIGFMTAAADLSAKQYFIVDVSADKAVNLASSAGQAVLGVLQNDPVSGATALVRTSGVSKVEVGTGGLAAGDLVQANANGEAIAAASGDYTVGMCLIGAAAGELATIKVTPSAGQVN